VYGTIIVASKLSTTSMGWRDRAACLGTYNPQFFHQHSYLMLQAKAVCRDCTVVDECLQYALSHTEQEGVWGGMTPRERQRFRRKENTDN
jgi:WhiB family redox-sensing transcriptional regulator